MLPAGTKSGTCGIKPVGYSRFQQVSKADISRVTTRDKAADSLANGALIGTAVGFGTGFLGWAAFNDHATSGPWWDREAAGYAAGFGLVGALAGFLVGTGVDGIIKEPEVLYEAY